MKTGTNPSAVTREVSNKDRVQHDEGVNSTATRLASIRASHMHSYMYRSEITFFKVSHQLFSPKGVHDSMVKLHDED